MTTDAEFTSSPRNDSYDCVVVGSGLGGLSSSAFLAKAGQKVLLVERLDGPGGYAHAFRRGEYVFDPAVHAVGQAYEGGLLDTWLRALGVRDRCNLIPLDPFYTVVLPDYTFTAPFGVEEFIEAHVKAFPHEEQGFREFMTLCQRIKDEWDQARPGTSLADLGRVAESFQTVLEHRSSSVGEVLEQYVQDPRLKAVCTAIWGYQGAPPSRLSFITFAGMTISLLEGGQTYCEGSFQNLVNAWVTALLENGGELVVGNEVTGILLDESKVRGVRLADGREISTPLVVSNADALLTFERLVGAEHFPTPFLDKLRKMPTSTSAFVVYAATTTDLPHEGMAHEIFVYNSEDYDEVWRDVHAGEIACVAVTAPSLVDPSLAPRGENTVCAVALMPYEIDRPWPEVKEEYTARMVDEIERVFPGFKSGLIFAEGATPQALGKYSLARNGAMYGWENNPRQTHSRRPSNRTPIEGLYLAGAWSQPGSGTINTMQSGFQTAQIILGYADRDEFLRELGYDATVPTAGL